MTDRSDLAQKWRKSSYSGTGNNCVEVGARRSGGIAVRDSRDPSGPRLAFANTAWQRFAEWVQAELS